MPSLETGHDWELIYLDRDRDQVVPQRMVILGEGWTNPGIRLRSNSYDRWRKLPHRNTGPYSVHGQVSEATSRSSSSPVHVVDYTIVSTVGWIISW